MGKSQRKVIPARCCSLTTFGRLSLLRRSMSSSYYNKQLREKNAYEVKSQFDQYILLDGLCHPSYSESPLSARGGKLCTKIPGRESMPSTILRPPTNAYASRTNQRQDYTPRLGLWSEYPTWETRSDYPNLGYASGDRDNRPPEETSQVSYWTGPLRRVPDQPYLVDNGYLRQDLAYDGIGFGSNARNDKYDYLYNFSDPDPSVLPPVPRKYDVTQLTQKYPIWKKATGTPDSFDPQNTRRRV